MNKFPGGVWPVMLTPFKNNGEVDYGCFQALTDWYLENGSDGLFAVCQSSEMYQMSLEERTNAVKHVVAAAAGRVPVIASAAICKEPEMWVKEIISAFEAGASAIILITNQFAGPEENDKIWLKNCLELVEQIPAEIPLGFYECPYPYKRLISTENLRSIAETGRFYFLKDTCCDLQLMKNRIDAVKGTNLKLYNANTTTLLDSLRYGAAGFSGVMANFHADIYKYLYEHRNSSEAEEIQAFLTISSLIERQFYPVNAKYHMNVYENIPIGFYSRRQDWKGLSETFRKEVSDLHSLELLVREKFH